MPCQLNIASSQVILQSTGASVRNVWRKSKSSSHKWNLIRFFYRNKFLWCLIIFIRDGQKIIFLTLTKLFIPIYNSVMWIQVQSRITYKWISKSKIWSIKSHKGDYRQKTKPIKNLLKYSFFKLRRTSKNFNLRIIGIELI